MKKRIRLFFTSVLNFITDIFTPVLSAIVMIAVLFPIPAKYLVILKTIEEYAKKVGATKEDVKDLLK